MEERGVHVFVQKETGGVVVVVGDSSRFDFRGILSVSSSFRGLEHEQNLGLRGSFGASKRSPLAKALFGFGFVT